MQKNYNENLVAGAAIRDDKGRRISKLFEASHPKMTVGYAKNLIMPNDPTEQEFNFRQSGGGVIEDGIAVIDKVKGNSVVWNQLVKKTTQGSTTLNGLTFYPQENGEVLITGVATENSYASIREYLGYEYKSVANHKAFIQIFGDATRTIKLYVPDNLQIPTNLGIVQWGKTGENGILYIPKGYDCGQGVRLRFIVIDLTQMFGAGNEPATYEEFLQRKPKVEDEYAYNEGEIINNKVEKVVTTGRNIWDEEWEVGEINEITCQNQTSSSDIRSKNFIRVIGGNNYFFKDEGNGTLRIFQYDADKNPILSWNSVYNFKSIKNDYFSLQANCVYIRFCTYNNYGTTYNHDICINLSDPAINGQYFPYEEHTLDLAWIKEIKDTEGVKLFEDGMRSAGTAFDEVGKNKAVKRFGVKVFDGTENFGRFQYSSRFWYFRLDVPTWGTIVKSQYLCNKYVYKGAGTSLLNEDKTIASYYSNTLCLIRDDSFENVDSFKQHLAELHAAGTPLVVYYELAEPIEVEYDEKSITYPVVAGGTEEAIASEPSSAFRADIGYGIDAVKTILDLKARVEALEGK